MQITQKPQKKSAFNRTVLTSNVGLKKLKFTAPSIATAKGNARSLSSINLRKHTLKVSPRPIVPQSAEIRTRHPTQGHFLEGSVIVSFRHSASCVFLEILQPLIRYFNHLILIHRIAIVTAQLRVRINR